MDPNNPEDQQQNEPIKVTSQPGSSIDTPFTPDPANESPSKGRKFIVPLVAAAILLFIFVPIGVMAVTPNTFVHKMLTKSNANDNQSSASETNDVDLVERKVNKHNITASILVPSNWRDNLSRENFKQYIPTGGDRGEKLIEIHIVDGDIKIPNNLSDADLQQAKADAIAKEESAYRKILKDCTIERSDYPNLSKDYYGSIYKEKCIEGIIDYEVVFGIIRNLEGTQIEFTLQNSEPNKLSQTTVDKIVKSFKFN